MAMFQIIEALPTYCQITDGIIGTHYRRHEMAYHRADAAVALAAAFGRRNYENCGDSSFFVVEAGAPVLNKFGQPNRINYMFSDAGGNWYDTGISTDEVPF